jgi:thiol-disulfide isomerase/thioredoxin
MAYLKKQWEQYKAKSTWSKIIDLFYLAFFIAVVTPQGRTFLQRSLLELGLFSSTEVNEDAVLSETSLNWKLTDMNGKTILFSDLKGEVIFLNFWSTWCGPCTAEMPNIIELMERMEGSATFVFASHEAAETVQNYIAKKEWNIPAHVYSASPGSELHHGSLPSTFIINRAGKVVHRSSGMKNWNSKETVDLLNKLATEAD